MEMLAPPPEANCFHSLVPSVVFPSSGARTSTVKLDQLPLAAATASGVMSKERVPGTTWQVAPSPPYCVGPQAGSASWLFWVLAHAPSPGLLLQFRCAESQMFWTGCPVACMTTGVSEPEAAQSLFR